MEKLIKLYKNNYFKFFVFILFMFFMFKYHPSFKKLKNETKRDRFKENKRKIVKKIKTVMSEIKDGHSSYTTEIKYEYEDRTEKNKNEKNNIISKIDKKINDKIISELKEKKVKKDDEKIKKQEIEKLNKIQEEFKVKEKESSKKINKCGDFVKYEMVTFINNQLSSSKIQSFLVIGSNLNKNLENRFYTKKKNDVFEISVSEFIKGFSEEIKDIQNKSLKEVKNKNKYYNNIDYYNINNNIPIKYRIKVLEITKSNPQIINKYCKDEK
jgi:hypothetical protein